jgi:hypothetical protein
VWPACHRPVLVTGKQGVVWVSPCQPCMLLATQGDSLSCSRGFALPCGCEPGATPLHPLPNFKLALVPPVPAACNLGAACSIPTCTGGALC